MLNRLNVARKNEKGFTLVELLVVIIIIGILAAVAIPAFLNQRQRANDAAVISDIKNLSAQVESALVQSPNALVVTGGTDDQSGTLYMYVGDDIAMRATVLTSTNSTFTVNLSKGVVVRTGGASSAKIYHLKGFHTNGKQFASQAAYFLYDSAAGGSKGQRLATVTPWL